MIYTIPKRASDVRKKGSLVRNIFNRPKHGAESMYIQLTKKVGVKIFPKKESAEHSMIFQQKAHKKGIGPKVLSRVKECYVKDFRNIAPDLFYKESGSINKPDVPLKYGYFYKTEVAETNFRYSKWLEQKMNELTKLAMEIEHNKEVLGSDVHKHNVGFIGDKLVLIDFGEYSTDGC